MCSNKRDRHPKNREQAMSTNFRALPVKLKASKPKQQVTLQRFKMEYNLKSYQKLPSMKRKSIMGMTRTMHRHTVTTVQRIMSQPSSLTPGVNKPIPSKDSLKPNCKKPLAGFWRKTQTRNIFGNPRKFLNFLQRQV